MLLQWGSLDHMVLKEETDRIYASIASANKKLVIYENADHESFLQKDPGKWRKEIAGFLATNNK